MNNLEKQRLINRENLNPTHYFQSFLQEAYRLKLITDSEFENIQLHSIQLLAKQTELYTGGESSSVKIETAQNILQSIFYSLGIYLKSFPDADTCVELLKQKPLLEMYLCGKELIVIQLDSAKQLLDAIQNDSIITENQAYNDTIQTGIPIFFSSYDVEFAAHDTPGSIDYPLSNDKMELVGIEYIYNYLHKLFLENQFCKNFMEHDINCLLRGYHENYQDLLINIFELVLTNAIGCILININPLQLNIEAVDKKFLQQTLETVSKEKLTVLVQDASTQLYKELNVSDKLLQKHIELTLLNLSAKLKHALETNQLDSLIVSLKENQAQTIIRFEDGEKVSDELFRSIADEIRACRYVSDKIAIIQREIHCITDLVDILEGYCIFEDEYFEIFGSLGDMELALLLKRSHLTENENEWNNRLILFLKEIDSTRSECIRELAEKINLD